MEKTKNKILRVSLELFNEQGLAKVTLRTIANELGISQGNLNYHFKKREDILEALYFSLVEHINEQVQGQMKNGVTLQFMMDLTTSVMEILADYRFLMLDLVQIMRENERIGTHFRQLVQGRKDQFEIFFKVLVANGIMRKEELPNEYDHFYTRIQMLGDYWISYAEVINQVNARTNINQYIQILSQSIYPYLTEKGKEEFNMLKLG